MSRLFTPTEVVSLNGLAPMPPSGRIQLITRDRSPQQIIDIARCWQSGIPFCFTDTSVTQSCPIPATTAVVFQTSGTTAAPKTVAIQRHQLEAAVASARSNFDIDPGHAWLHCLPAHHAGGLNVVIRSLIAGTDVVWLPAFDADAVANALMHNQRIQAVSLVPTQLYRLLERPQFRPHNGFKAILLGGGPASPGLLRSARSRGIPVIFSYGMTETCGQVCATPFDKRLDPDAGGTGPALAGLTIQIADGAGQPVTHGADGLIWVRGPQVITAYLDERLNEGRFLPDAGFLTLDWGRMLPGGSLDVISRRDDLIVSGGENVAPREVEDAVLATGLVQSAVAVGVIDPLWGQAVAVAVDGDPRVEPDLKRALLALEPRLRPKRYVWNLDIPRTEGGKIRRQALRDLLEGRQTG